MRFAVFLLLIVAGYPPLALQAQASDRFAAYEHCSFSDDLALVETAPLAKGIEGRAVKTVMGTRNVPLAGGTRLMYGYAGTEPFANVKIEQIPASSYTQAKQDLTANFEQILTADDSSTRNYALKPRLNGLEIYGLDRNKLEGGVLGIYLFFADRTHTATTIYFLNQDPTARKFADLAGYATLRDSFLETITGCAAARSRPSVPATATVRDSPATPEDAPTPVTMPDAAALPDAPLPAGSAAQNAAPAAVTTAASPVTARKAAAVTKAHLQKSAHAPARKAAVQTRKPGKASATAKKAPAKTKPKAS